MENLINNECTEISENQLYASAVKYFALAMQRIRVNDSAKHRLYDIARIISSRSRKGVCFGQDEMFDTLFYAVTGIIYADDMFRNGKSISKDKFDFNTVMTKYFNEGEITEYFSGNLCEFVSTNLDNIINCTEFKRNPHPQKGILVNLKTLALEARTCADYKVLASYTHKGDYFYSLVEILGSYCEGFWGKVDINKQEPSALEKMNFFSYAEGPLYAKQFDYCNYISQCLFETDADLSNFVIAPFFNKLKYDCPNNIMLQTMMDVLTLSVYLVDTIIITEVHPCELDSCEIVKNDFDMEDWLDSYETAKVFRYGGVLEKLSKDLRAMSEYGRNHSNEYITEDMCVANDKIANILDNCFEDDGFYNFERIYTALCPDGIKHIIEFLTACFWGRIE